MMISAICIVKATRSQKPAPNHWALWTGDAPAARLAANTMAQAESASANASGNQRSNQAERRRPIEASETLTSATGPESDDGPVLLEDRADVVGRERQRVLPGRVVQRIVEAGDHPHRIPERGMRRDVLHSLSVNPDLPSVANALEVLGARERASASCGHDANPRCVVMTKNPQG